MIRAISTDSCVIDDNIFQRAQVEQAVVLMDRFVGEPTEPEIGDIVLFNEQYVENEVEAEIFRIIVTGPTSGTVIRSSNESQVVGSTRTDWDWNIDPDRWTNLGRSTL